MDAQPDQAQDLPVLLEKKKGTMYFFGQQQSWPMLDEWFLSPPTQILRHWAAWNEHVNPLTQLWQEYDMQASTVNKSGINVME